MDGLIMLIPMAAVAVWAAAIIALFCLPRVHSKSRCAVCGYSRAGLSDRSNCPECGHAHGIETDPGYRTVIAKPYDRLGLIIGPIAIGFVGSIVAFALSIESFGVWAAPWSLTVGIAPALPILLVGLLASGRISRRVVWALAMISPLPGVAFSTAGFAPIAREVPLDPLTGVGIIFICVYGGVISTFVAGLLGCIAAAYQRRRNSKLRHNRSSVPRLDSSSL